MRTPNSPSITSSYQEFYEFLGQGRYEEKIYNLEIRPEKYHATIDFDCSFAKNGTIENWGREYWALVKVAGEWKITSVIWTTNLQKFEVCPFNDPPFRETEKSRDSTIGSTVSERQQKSRPKQQPEPVLKPEIIERANLYLQSMMVKQGIVGLGYSILLDGKIKYQHSMGYANNEHRVPVRESTLFAVASLSKIESSTALHRLLRLKDRHVDETILDLLPNRTDFPESWQRLRLRQIPDHTSCIQDLIHHGFFLAPESDDLVLQKLKDKPFI